MDKNTYRVATVPNLLTTIRLLIAGFIIALAVALEQPESWLTAATAMAAFAFMTDWLDGFIARRWPSQQSRVGEIADPVVDKFAVMTFIAYLYAAGVLSFDYNAETVLIALMILREVAISVIRCFVSMPVSWWGKSKTVVQMFALIGYGWSGFVGMQLPFVLLLISFGLSVYSFGEYIYHSRFKKTAVS